MENSFINYFDKETEIYKGMKKIDDELGGTTLLNVIIKFPVKEKKRKPENDEFLNGKRKKMRKIKLNIVYKRQNGQNIKSSRLLRLIA